jgi:hypothetical protein
MSVAVIVGLLLAEAAFRIAFGIPVFHIEDFRFTQTIRDTLPNIAGYDPVLGWHLNPNVHLVGQQNGADLVFSTIDYGIRKNKESDDKVRTDAVLVVGSSFAAGSEVSDDGTFPAQLETIIGTPVVNGAIGGFGVDQIVLRTEQLVPIVRPKILIVDISSSNVTYASFSEAGRPKPFYTIVNGALVLHNSPVPTHFESRDRFEWVKQIAGYSYAINRIMGSFSPDDWFNDKGARVTRINNDPAAVSCLLLARLNQEARAAGVARILLSVQHGGQETQTWNEIPGDLATVEDCARDLAIEVVDEFDAMKTLSKADPAKFDQDYVLEEPSHILGHKSSAGNRHVAERLAAALAMAPPPSAVPQPTLQAIVPGDGINLLPRADLFRSSTIATVAKLAPPDGGDGYELEARGENSEHYVATSASSSVAGGPLTLSLEAHLGQSPQLWLQIVSPQGDGVMGHFDLAYGTVSPQSTGHGRQIHAAIDPAVSGWVPLTLGVTLPGPTTPVVIVHLVDDKGASTFVPTAQKIEVRHIKLERGQTATPYDTPEIGRAAPR